MRSTKYQSWEEEFEAPELNEDSRAIFPMVLAAVIGILIFTFLIVRTILQQYFKSRPRVQQNKFFLPKVEFTGREVDEILTGD